MSAQTTWYVTLALALGLALAALTWDLVLYWAGHETVSDWLRTHRSWFFWPVSMLAGFMLGLTLHLFYDVQSQDLPASAHESPADRQGEGK